MQGSWVHMIHHQYKCRGTYVGHQSEIWCLITCGDILITGSSDKTIKVWDNSSSFKCQQSLEAHTSQVFSLLKCGNYLYIGSADGLIIIWDLDSFEQQGALCVRVRHWRDRHWQWDAVCRSQNFIGVYNFSDPWDLRKRINMPP